MNKRYSPTQRTLSGLALVLSAWAFQAPTAFAACECLCVDGAPYNVCTEGFAGQTTETTQACTEALATDCPVPDPDTAAALDQDTTGEPAAEDPVVAEASKNGLDCKRRQVYRPDLGRHKVYKVCMPAGLAVSEAKRAEAKQRLAERKVEKVAAHQERKAWKGNWEKQDRKAHSRTASWDWRDQQHWKSRNH